MFNKIDIELYKSYMTKYPNGKSIFEALTETLSSYNKSVEDVNAKVAEGLLAIDAAYTTLHDQVTALFSNLETEYNEDFTALQDQVNLSLADKAKQSDLDVISAQLGENENKIDEISPYIIEKENPALVIVPDKFLNNIGNVGNAAGLSYTSLINIEGFDYVQLNKTYANVNITLVGFYNVNIIDNTYLVQQIFSVEDGDKIPVPALAKYVAFSGTSAFCDGLAASLIKDKVKAQVDVLTQTVAENTVEINDISQVKSRTPNIMPPDMESGYWNTDGTSVINAGYKRTPSFVPIPENGGKLYISFNPKATLPFSISAVMFFDVNKNFISQKTGAKIGWYCDIPVNAKYLKLWVGASSSTFDLKNVCLSLSWDTYELYEYKRTIKNINKVGLAFGDSITEGVGVLYENEFPPIADAISVIANTLDYTMYNAGIGGTKFYDSEGSFNRIVDAILDNSWTGIDGRIAALGVENPIFLSLPVQYAKIKALDLNDVDFITIAYGRNDWTALASKALDNAGNPEDINTILGSLRYGVKRLMLAYPHLRFYVFTPIFSYKLDGDVAKNTDNTMVAGMYLKDVGDAIETACKALHIPCANMYYKSNINADNASYYSADGTHFNAKGYKLLGEKHAKVIQST